MASAPDLCTIGAAVWVGALIRWVALRGPGCLAYGVGEGLEVVTARTNVVGVGGEPDDLPASRRGEPFGVLGTQVVAMRLGVHRQWPKHGGRVGVDVRERRDGVATARGTRAASGGAHGGRRYRPGPTGRRT